MREIEYRPQNIREDDRLYDPADETTFRAEDRLVLKGPQHGENRLRRLADGYRRT